MAYITKFNGNTDKTIKVGGAGNPSSIEGYFLGSKDTKSDYGPGKLHLFQTSEGIVGVWGKSRMNTLLTDSHRGQMVLLSFTGMIPPSKKGRQPAYGYQLQYDPNNTIDVSNVDVNATPEATTSEEDETDNTTYSSASYEVEEEAEEEVIAPPPPRATAPKVAARVPDSSQQAKMQALLSKNRAKV